MKRSGTMNFKGTTLYYMENHPNDKANTIGKQVPYHLQCVREEKKKEQQALKQRGE